MIEEALFARIEHLQGATPWGRFLDAGTGEHSLQWVAGLRTASWTAVTIDAGRARRLEKLFRSSRRRGDRVIDGSWRDPAFLQGEVFETVLADYLIGAVDRFTPYFQYEILERLRPHVGERLYIVGLEPYPETARDGGGRLILEIARLRHACILHAGDRPNREYPLSWLLAALERAGFRVEDAREFPILYGESFVRRQCDVARRKLPRLQDRALARSLEHHIAELETRALAYVASYHHIAFGKDYVVHAGRAPAG